MDDEHTPRSTTVEEKAIEKLQEEVADLKEKQKAMSAFLEMLDYRCSLAPGQLYSEIVSGFFAEIAKTHAVLSGLDKNIKDDGVDENNNITE